MTRYFINRQKGSNKFWTILIKNETLIICFGRAGTAGREFKKKFVTKATCKEAYNKLVKEKLSKGYIETKTLTPQPPRSTSRFSPLNKIAFWKLINASLRHSSITLQAKYLKKELKGFSKKDLAAFDHIFNRLENASYTWNLWAAAYTIHGGCSDDGFADFRGWLITRGQKVYEKALAASDSLYALGRKKLAQSKDGEYFLYIANTIYEDLYKVTISNDGYSKSLKAKTRPSGREWKENDIEGLKKINPTLFSLFKGKWY